MLNVCCAYQKSIFMVYFLFAGSLHTVHDVVVAAVAVVAVDVCTHHIEKKMKTPNIHTHNKPHKIRNKHRNETKKHRGTHEWSRKLGIARGSSVLRCRQTWKEKLVAFNHWCWRWVNEISFHNLLFIWFCRSNPYIWNIHLKNLINFVWRGWPIKVFCTLPPF